MATYRDIIDGLEILSRHCKDGKEARKVAAEHDVIYAGADEDIGEADLARLEGLKWHWDEECDCWARFV